MPAAGPLSSNATSLKSLLQEGMQGWNGSRPFGATPPELSYAIAKSTDRGGSWKLTLAPSFMLGALAAFHALRSGDWSPPVT